MEIVMWIILTIAPLAHLQSISVQDLTNNNGYLPFKEGEIDLIEFYRKVLHIINITKYEDSMFIIQKNIDTLAPSLLDDKPLLDSIKNNFVLLRNKLENLIPHHKQKRGLANFLGTGLKMIAGTMDNDDQVEISKALEALSQDNSRVTKSVDTLTLVSNSLSQQISNITNHINFQQNLVSKYINNFKNELQNKIMSFEDELTFLKHVYQIDNDINLLRNHIDDIGHIIYTSKLGIIPSDLFTSSELDLIENFKEYTKTKVSIAVKESILILTLSIPKLSNITLSKIVFEPIPNLNKKALYLDDYVIAIDQENNLYDTHIKDNLKKNLKQVDNKCVEEILKNVEASCDMQKFTKQEIKEIKSGFVIFKNFYNESILTTCNKKELKTEGTFLIQFENCKIETKKFVFDNNVKRVQENFILPSLITKLKENFTIENIQLQDLVIQHNNYMQEVDLRTNNMNIIRYSTDISIGIILIILCGVVLAYRKRVRLLHISSEPQTNGGGVTITPIQII